MGWSVRVTVLGGLSARLSGHSLRGKEIGSRKARTLLALLAVRAGETVEPAALVEALWPEGPPRRPAQEVATLVSRLRATLGREAVEGGRAGYRLGPRVRVDLADAEALVLAARSEVDGAGAYRRALSLLEAGAVLGDLPEAGWAEPARARHTVLLREARHAIAAFALRTGDVALARELSRSAVAADPFDEIGSRLLMRAHQAAGEPARALMEYERLRAALAGDLGTRPAAETSHLHVTVLRGDAPARR